MAPFASPALPPGRLEEAFADKAPLYASSEAKAEADRCLYCHDAPCIHACPTAIDIPLFIRKIATGNVRGAARTILEANLLGYSCARVCPVEVLCVGACVYNHRDQAPIAIGRLQRFATEGVLGSDRPIFRGAVRSSAPRVRGRVGLIGAGPASLACGGTLALAGIEAVLFERQTLPGGLNTTGVAPYKMHAPDSLREVEWIRSLGVRIETGREVGRDPTAATLLDEYDAVFLGIGLGGDSLLGIPGENGEGGDGVYGATALIERLKTVPGFSLDGALGRVLVIGGGNTAIDAARELKQLGASAVTLVYRRSEAEMSGYAHEMAEARLEGVRMLESTIPLEVLRDAGHVQALRVARAERGRPLPGTEQVLPADIVVFAIGQSRLRALVELFPGVELDESGRVVVDPVTGRTGNPKVYSGGDCANGGKEVVNAVAEGQRAARAILETLNGATRG